MIVPESDTEAIRVIRQLIANDQRAELTDGERAAAWKQLELDGLSVTAIAPELSEMPKRVKVGRDCRVSWRLFELGRVCGRCGHDGLEFDRVNLPRTRYRRRRW